MTIYPLFTDFFTSLQGIFSDPIISVLTGGSGLLSTGGGGDMTTKSSNLVKYGGGKLNIFGAWDMLANIPGSNCFQVGYKVTSADRMIGGFGIQYIV